MRVVKLIGWSHLQVTAPSGESRQVHPELNNRGEHRDAGTSSTSHSGRHTISGGLSHHLGRGKSHSCWGPRDAMLDTEGINLGARVSLPCFEQKKNHESLSSSPRCRLLVLASAVHPAQHARRLPAARHCGQLEHGDGQRLARGRPLPVKVHVAQHLRAWRGAGSL